MGFGTKNIRPQTGNSGGYHYAPDYNPDAKSPLGWLVKIGGTGVLLMFGWVALTLSGVNPIGEAKYNAAMEEAVQSMEASVDQTLLEDSVMTQYRQFSETLIVLRACEQNYYDRSKHNRNDKTHIVFRTALRDYQNKNLDAYQQITRQITMRAAGSMLRQGGAAVQTLHQDIGMLYRPTNGDTAKLAAYDKIATKGKDQAYCNATLGKVRSGNVDIKI